MNWNEAKNRPLTLYLVAILIVAVGSAVRVVFFEGLGRGTAYLTYYPAIMLAAVFGGIRSGLLATFLSALLCYFWIQRGYMSAIEWMAMSVFLFSCIMISGVAEAMQRAQAQARREKERAEEASLAKSRFLASMSHELRTPLNAILGFSNLMRNDQGLTAEQIRTLDIINRSGDHLLNLINDILDIAKVEAGRINVENVPFDIGEMIRDIIELLGGRAERKGLQLILDQTSDFPRFVEADGPKLRQILINLVGNAIKYTEKGNVTLRLNAKAATSGPPETLHLMIEVEDTGVGVSHEDKKRIFDPFVQAGTSNAEKGTGLGLAITRQYVEMMGGVLSVESAPGKGSLFRVELPAKRVAEDLLKVEIAGRRQVVSLAPGQRKFRALIVEDQVENWMLLRRILESVGFEVEIAQNGAEGVDAFQRWRPDFIWMDCRMPVMDGLEAARRIRSLDGGVAVKIVALTASIFKEERERVMEAGMDDFMHKPFLVEEIYVCMERHLGVRFIYREAATQPEVATPDAIDAGALKALPRELLVELAECLVSLDIDAIKRVVDRVGEFNAVLSGQLSQYAGKYQYTAISQALKAAGVNRNQ